MCSLDFINLHTITMDPVAGCSGIILAMSGLSSLLQTEGRQSQPSLATLGSMYLEYELSLCQMASIHPVHWWISSYLGIWGNIKLGYKSGSVSSFFRKGQYEENILAHVIIDPCKCQFCQIVASQSVVRHFRIFYPRYFRNFKCGDECPSLLRTKTEQQSYHYAAGPRTGAFQQIKLDIIAPPQLPAHLVVLNIFFR